MKRAVARAGLLVVSTILLTGAFAPADDAPALPDCFAEVTIAVEGMT